MELELETEFVMELYLMYQAKFNKDKRLMQKNEVVCGKAKNTKTSRKFNKTRDNYCKFHRELINRRVLEVSSGSKRLMKEYMPRQEYLNTLKESARRGNKNEQIRI